MMATAYYFTCYLLWSIYNGHRLGLGKCAWFLIFYAAVTATKTSKIEAYLCSVRERSGLLFAKLSVPPPPLPLSAPALTPVGGASCSVCVRREKDMEAACEASVPPHILLYTSQFPSTRATHGLFQPLTLVGRAFFHKYKKWRKLLSDVKETWQGSGVKSHIGEYTFVIYWKVVSHIWLCSHLFWIYRVVFSSARFFLIIPNLLFAIF